jgi:hypothetical protein
VRRGPVTHRTACQERTATRTLASVRPPPPHHRWSSVDTAWAIGLPVLLLAGWAGALALLWGYVVGPVLAAGLMWSTLSPAEERRATVAAVVALVVIVATPAVVGLLAWRRGWRTAGRGCWIAGGAVVALLAVWYVSGS